jgi:hypothetical protein
MSTSSIWTSTSYGLDLIALGTTRYLDRNWCSRACSYLQPMWLHEIYMIEITMILRWRKSWWLWSKVCNGGEACWLWWRLAAQVLLVCRTCSSGLGKRGWQHGWTIFLVALFM